jgi:CcmD family protein
MNTVNQNWNFVFAAYSVSWVMLLGYAIHVHRALARARRRYEAAVLTGSPAN